MVSSVSGAVENPHISPLSLFFAELRYLFISSIEESQGFKPRNPTKVALAKVVKTL